MTKITRLSGAAVCKKPVLNLSENVRWMTKRLESDLDYELRYKTCDAKKLKRLLGYQNALIQ